MTRGRRHAVWLLAGIALIGLCIAGAKAAGVHVSRVVSSSMSPEIRRGDWIVTRDVDQEGRRSIDRQDIVLFRFPLGTAGRAVKRVVAIEGDEVAIDESRVAVNGRVIPVAGAPSPSAARRRVETVPPRHVFLLGDNAAVSIDSRSFGPVPEAELVGRVRFVVPNRAPLYLFEIATVATLIAGGLLVRRRLRNAS